MINDDNSKVTLKEFHPMKIKVLSTKGSFVCRRAVGVSVLVEED